MSAELAIDRVWVFHGDGAQFASGVFFDEAQGLAWVERHHLTGVLAEYPAGGGCYDVAVHEGRFRSTKPHHGSPADVAAFGPGLRHVHVIDGHRA
ncbi:hypothetical protein ABZS66_09900 [Dactylosporangium sp. NPDC005572]|uniref:DUF7710 domain-containing protein n=1 Tax=Dactylosporangium sp. NPDC005572 TaxID=3156889 RepID=UPI0033BBBA98